MSHPLEFMEIAHQKSMTFVSSGNASVGCLKVEFAQVLKLIEIDAG